MITEMGPMTDLILFYGVRLIVQSSECCVAWGQLSLYTLAHVNFLL